MQNCTNLALLYLFKGFFNILKIIKYKKGFWVTVHYLNHFYTMNHPVLLSYMLVRKFVNSELNQYVKYNGSNHN